MDIAFLTGQRITLRNVQGLPRVTGTLRLADGMWFLENTSAAVDRIDLVGVGHESAIIAALELTPEQTIENSQSAVRQAAESIGLASYNVLRNVVNACAIRPTCETSHGTLTILRKLARLGLVRLVSERRISFRTTVCEWAPTDDGRAIVRERESWPVARRFVFKRDAA